MASDLESRDSEGPWIASCQYWQPVRRQQSSTHEEDTKVFLVIKSKGTELRATADAKSAVDVGSCSSQAGIQHWGIPNRPSPSAVAPSVHGVVAIVPDPIHTHLALDFDREIDTIVQAAGDNGYLPSYFWLPWKSPDSLLPPGRASETERTHNANKREQEPGLIIFKRTRAPQEKDAGKSNEILSSNYFDVLYLFLVGETPSLGIDGAQFHNAIAYEAELSKACETARCDFKSSMDHAQVEGLEELSVIGPAESGSAASLAEAIEQDLDGNPFIKRRAFSVTGITETVLAGKLLNRSRIRYLSFGDNAESEKQKIADALSRSGVPKERIVSLSEDSTVFGAQVAQGDLVQLRFPRNISLLRNAHAEPDNQTAAAPGSVPSPYLHLSLRDSEAADAIPQFSGEHTALSQEAQLLAISRFLQRSRAEYIIVNATSVLDRLFLTQFLHRACPDARLVFIGGDLLFGRSSEDAQYIGTLTFSAYNLLSPLSAIPLNADPLASSRAFADSTMEGYYNAASFTFWNPNTFDHPLLADYHGMFESDCQRPALWATAVGTDGYYPLGIVSNNASDDPSILPEFPCSEDSLGSVESSSDVAGSTRKPGDVVRTSPAQTRRVDKRFPALSWTIICSLLTILCFGHVFAIKFARFWSPWTRDLAIEQGDRRHRRSMYILLSAVTLFCMAFASAFPAFQVLPFFFPACRILPMAACELLAGLLAVSITVSRTGTYLLPRKLPPSSESKKRGVIETIRQLIDKNVIFAVAFVVCTAQLLFMLIWTYLCTTGQSGAQRSFAGAFFSFRCLYPGSGVSPLVPVLLTLLGWYLWAVCQALRLRFSDKSRPRLPEATSNGSGSQFYVSDSEISRCETETDTCLVSNITCLLITRRILKKAFPNAEWWPMFAVAGAYLGLLVLLTTSLKIIGIDHFLFPLPWISHTKLAAYLPATYELLMCGLVLPLIGIAIAGWFRMLLIWSSLRITVLERLERLPLRYAFTRIKGVGWVKMMRQGGMVEQWRDMARSVESLRQMVNDKELGDALKACPHDEQHLSRSKVELEKWVEKLHQVIDSKVPVNVVGVPNAQLGMHCLIEIEKCLASASGAVLGGILVPYWTTSRVGTVEGAELMELPLRARMLPKVEGKDLHTPVELHASTIGEEPMYVRAAEEFLAIRYVSLIRAVLVNISRLLFFISAVFVLTIVAWNSYPFQPRALVDAGFTLLMFLLGTGVVLVLAQIHRNPLLNRITDTNANELGFDFYSRILALGSIPVLTWLAYEFPDIGGKLFRLIQPGLGGLK